jgi:hypothetical protein
MADINFGILDTQLPGRIAAIPQEAQKQQTANMLQAMQMQGAMRQNEMSQMQLDELKSDRAEMIKLQQSLAAKGGSPDLGQYADLLMKSPKYLKLGIELKQKLSAQARFDKINSGDASPPAPPEASANMLPGVVSPPAGVNNLPAAPQAQTTIANLNRQIAANMALGTDQGYKYAEMLQKRADALSKLYTVGNTLMGSEGQIVGTAPEATTQEIRTMRELGYPNTPAGYAAFRDTQRQERLLTPAEEAQKVRIAGASRPPAQPVAPTITTVEDPTRPGKFLQVDARQYLGGGAGSPGVIGGAKPSATTEKIAAQRTQLGKDLGFAITQLTDITKDGGLIDQSTGSGAGRLTDIGAGFFGAATPGAIAIGKIAPIADLALKVVPRFEGPQSNADTKSYKEAAGQLADSSLPTKIRKEAGKVVLRIMQARKDQFVTNDMAAEGATSGSGIVDFGSLK